MHGDIRKALEIISRRAAMAQGNRSFGHLRPKIGGDESLGIEDGEEVGMGKLHGMPTTAKTPGEEMNSLVQEDVLSHQDHQLPDDEFLFGTVYAGEPDADDFGGPSDNDEDDMPKAQGKMGFMATKAMPKAAPYPRDGIAETAKRRRGRPRGSKA